jgi:hypothetical protein
MKNYFIIVLLFILGVFLTSCRKDKMAMLPILNNEVDTCSCVAVPPIEGYGAGYNFVQDSNYLNFPIFNPNNEDEIIYGKNLPNGSMSLIKYNLVTKTKTLIFEGQIFGYPSWGKSNWIVFVNGYNGLYRIRPDGTQLSMIVPGGLQFHPKFNKNGDRFVTYHGFLQNSIYSGKIWNLDGELLDSISYYGSKNLDWNMQNNISTQIGDSLFIIDPENKKRLAGYSALFGGTTFMSEFIWINQNEALVRLSNENYKFNIWTGAFQKLFCSCSSRTYAQANINGDATKVVYNKLTYKKIDYMTLAVTSRVAVYDIVNDEMIEYVIE